MKKNMKSRNVIIKTAANVFTPIFLIYSVYVIIYGPVGVGSGLQGGLLLSASIVLIYLGYGREKVLKTFRIGVLFKNAFALGILYILLGATGVMIFANYGKNIFLGQSRSGSLISTGNIMFMNILTGLIIFASVGYVIIFIIRNYDNKDINKE